MMLMMLLMLLILIYIEVTADIVKASVNEITMLSNTMSADSSAHSCCVLILITDSAVMRLHELEHE